jgi:MoaA/NifB/PqqE/SkfB family radical SAM enzyme
MTERCNLRCAHCITHAPRLTREGRARSLEPWLLPRLRDAFQAMSYLGFVHGGESLVARDFFATLSYVQAARARVHARLDIHLLSNGMLLDVECVQRLVDHGVTSLAVSLDGGSAATNDKLRIGGSFQRVVKNLEAVLALRARTGADLRVGLSSVVSKSSLAELERLAALCVELGLDWLKLEEMYGATGCAAEQIVPAGDTGLLAALERVSQRLQRAGVVFVDHTRSKPACACASDADTASAAFRAADDFANRAQFRPCRMLWEQAAIDADGSVRPVDYTHGVLGSLQHDELLELWNGEVVRAARALALTRLSRPARERCAHS